jgi:hypothetical protein
MMTDANEIKGWETTMNSQNSNAGWSQVQGWSKPAVQGTGVGDAAVALIRIENAMANVEPLEMINPDLPLCTASEFDTFLAASFRLENLVPGSGKFAPDFDTLPELTAWTDAQYARFAGR